MKESVWLTLVLAVGLVAVSARYAFVSNGMSGDAGDESAGLGAETVESIMTRASVRGFTDEAPSDSVVQVLLHAGMAAHSCGNKQPWRMIVLIDDDLKDSIAGELRNKQAVREAPLAIVVCGVPGETYGGCGDGYWVADCSAMSQNIGVAAHAMGLGSVTCAVYPHAERVSKVRCYLELPDSVVPYAVIPVGYPKAAGRAKDKWDEEKVSYI